MAVDGIDAVALSGRNPASVESKQADSGRDDGRIRLARPSSSQARKWSAKKTFFLIIDPRLQPSENP